MKTPGFWSSDGFLPRLLGPVSLIWGLVAGRRMRAAPSGRAPVAVLAVGNFTAGGAGKTPTVAALVRIARAAGLSPAVVTRGHGGRLAGPVRVDGTIHSALDVGDEPLLLAGVAPTFVSRDRLAGARLAAAGGADLVILDDGFQNPALHRDFALVVVDRGQGIGNGRVMPGGPLRAPLAVQLERAGAIVTIDSGEAAAASVAPLLDAARARGIATLGARLAPRDPGLVAGRRVVAFAGIGRPQKFAATLTAYGAEVVDLVGFGDHARLSGGQAADLMARAEAAGAVLVTTAKDAARMAGDADATVAQLAAAALVLDVDLVFDDEAAVRAILAGLAGRAT